MNKILLLSILTVFISCGGGSYNENNQIYKNIKDKYFYKQWYLANDEKFSKANDINLNANIHLGDYYKKYRGRGVKIVVIDNGIYADNDDLNIINLSENEEEHGTKVAGIIAAKANKIGIYGIANESEVYFLGYDERNFEDMQIIELFKKANELGADIINCSWGTDDVSEAVKEYIVELAKNGRDGKGILFVFANNNRGKISPNDESQIPEVISVGSTDTKNLRAGYSGYGKYLDVLAPGGDRSNDENRQIISLSSNGGVGYDAGTSFSAPIVSGVLALILQSNPNLTRAQIEQILQKTSDKIGANDYQNGHNIYYGYGKINAKKAIDEALGR